MTSDLSSDITAPNTDPGFNELGLSESLCKTLSELGYEQPSAIQAQAIGPFLENRDILGLAQTGTGKTAAFALPLMSNIDLKQKTPQALILAPTRELAIQVSEALQSYAKRMKGFHVLPIYGGQDMGSQLRQLKRGVHVVVGTPGRVMDHMRRKSLDLNNLNTLVLDEADEMLRMGFIDDVEWILEQIPEQRQLALFSATMPAAIARITKAHLNDPVEIRIEAKTRTVERISQSYTVVQNNRKLDALTRILEADGLEAAIIFVRTKNATMELAQKLEARGFSSAAINGDLNQKQRENTLANLKKGNIDILVATDVAARGIDVPRITLVVNYDIPYDAEAYVHRIGRTGRAGREGKALLLITPREKRLLHMIEKSTRQPIEHRAVPTNEQIGAQRSARFRERLMNVLENEPLDDLRELIEGISAETETRIEDLAVGLAYLAQESKPLRVAKESGLDSGSKGRQERKGRPEKSTRSRAEREAMRADIEMDIYRLEAGYDHGISVKDLVGAVANELEIDSDYIGQIRLDDDCSYVELPSGMPKELQAEFRKVRIKGQLSNASLTRDDIDMSVRGGAKTSQRSGAVDDNQPGSATKSHSRNTDNRDSKRRSKSRPDASKGKISSKKKTDRKRSGALMASAPFDRSSERKLIKPVNQNNI